MDEKTFLEQVEVWLKEYPDLSDQIEEYVTLAYDEIESGQSSFHEFELAYTDIKDLINDSSIHIK
jgi:hypothetical protein